MKKHLPVFAIITMAVVAMAATPKAISEKHTVSTKFNNEFSFIRTHRQAKNIDITWAFTAGGVAGFSIQRTYEDPTDPYATWTEVNSMPCNGSRSYKCADESVFPGYINYRVVALMTDGSSINSDVSTVHIVSH
jgi:hypothetical protein